MSSDWKDKLKEVKRQLEDRKMKKVLETRAREREAERPPARKLVVSQPVKQAPRSLAPLAPPKATTELSLIRVKEAIFRLSRLGADSNQRTILEWISE